jgi:hypothetical protein
MVQLITDQLTCFLPVFPTRFISQVEREPIAEAQVETQDFSSLPVA